MVLVQLGALRFAGLFSDFGSLPLDANLNGAIFDAVDTVQKWVFDGTAWTEFLGDTSGEDNTGANVGVGTGLLFRDKTGVTLNFKSLIGGTNITVTDNADDITLSSTGTSPLTTKGDMLGFTTVDARLPVGTDGQVLSANSVQGIGLEWIDAPSSSPLTTKGDLVAFSTLDVRLPVGTDEQVLTADATAVEGVRWKDAAGGGGGITGLEPNSTILEYSTDIADYTTPTSATATSESGGSGETISNPTGGNDRTLLSAGNVREAETLGAGSALIGQTLDEVSWYLKKFNSPTGTLTVNVRNSVDAVILTLGTLDVSTLTTGFVKTTFNTGSVLLAEGDRITAEYGGGDGSNYVVIDNKTTDGYDGTNTFRSSYVASWVDATTNDLKFEFVTIGGAIALFAIDGDTGTFWASDAGINESITLDMGSVVNCYGLAYYIDKVQSGITETEFQISTVGDPVPDITDDFVYASQAAANAVWVTNTDTDYDRVNVANQNLDFHDEVDGNIPRCSRDLLGSAISDTAWIIDYDFDLTAFTAYSSGSEAAYFGIGMYSTDNTVSVQTASDFLGFVIFSQGSLYNTTSCLNQNIVQGTDTVFTETPSVETFFIRMIRDGNNFTVSLYSDAERTTLVESQTVDATGVTGLRYFGVRGNGIAATTSNIQGTLDNFAFTDNATSFQRAAGDILRTVSVADLVDQSYNFIRFNGVNTQFIKVEGSSGNSLVMAANELAVQVETDPPLTTLHGQFTINGTDANLPLNGGDPTSTVIDDPQINTLTFNNVGTPNDPAAGKAVLWIETVDANNDGIFAKIKVDGTFKTVRVI